MKILKEWFTHIFCKSVFKKLYTGLFLAIHIDTRAVEFLSGVLSLLIGIFLTIPPNLLYYQWPSEYWAWTYILFGISGLISSIYGPWNFRKYLSLAGVYLWINLVIWICTGNRVTDSDDALIAAIPYSLLALTSIWTYLGLWRYTQKWGYYRDSSRIV